MNNSVWTTGCVQAMIGNYTGFMMVIRLAQEEREIRRQKALRDNLKRRKQMLKASTEKIQKPS